MKKLLLLVLMAPVRWWKFHWESYQEEMKNRNKYI
jgi:hypothetical protein